MTESDKNFYEAVYDIFYKFSHVLPEQVGLTFSKKVTYPVLEFIPEIQIILPLPKKIGEKYAFFGMLFEDSDSGQKSMWSLFLALLYHMASHAGISNYSNYDSWMKSKTKESIWKVIDFIEDVRVKKFLVSADDEIWDNVQNVECILRDMQKLKKKQTSEKNKVYREAENQRELELLESQIFNCKEDVDKKILLAADFLYANIHLIQDKSVFCYEHQDSKCLIKIEGVGPQMEPFGIFEEQVVNLNNLWQADERDKRQLMKRYQKYMKNLHFDSVVIPPGNMHNYAQIKSKTLPMLRRIKQQIRMIANLTDDPKIDQIGYVDMQMAIQAIASEGSSTDIFERDELRRGEEAWVILVDKSASMNLRFDKIKEFTVCISESANDLTGKYDAWALYSFDNNFQILKDFKEKYNREVQARIGSIEPGGLSLLPDAIELAQRVLNDDPRERKYIFVITDGHATGYAKISEAFAKIVKKVEVSDTTLVAIGVSKRVSDTFKRNAQGQDLKTLMAKFITAYRSSSSDM
ncbi:MAG: VWA domain-containing protein [Nitrosotalea sp.]